jgi:hypothetical protein
MLMKIIVAMIGMMMMKKHKGGGGMKKYKINLIGCDDCTSFEMELKENEFKLLKKVSELSEETSTYQCMPTMEIMEVENE